MQATGDRADFPAGTAVSGSSTADSSGINGPSTVCNALMRECDALVYHRQMLKRKRAELEQSLQKQRIEREVCPALFVFHSAGDLLRATQSDGVRRSFSAHGIAHQCVHNSAVLSSWSTPIGRGMGATCMKEYQKLFHAQYLTRTLRLVKEIYLCSANQVAVMRALTTLHTAPMLRRLELEVSELIQPMVQYISQWEAEGQLEYLAIGLRCITPTLKILFSLLSFKELNLTETRITDDNVRLLCESNTLMKINLRSCKALTNVNPLSCIVTLEVINLFECTSLTHVGALGKLPILKEVNLSSTRITDEEVRLLSESNTLVKIDLCSCKALTNVNPLSCIATLEVIDLSCCTSLTHLGALGKLPVLKEVNLSITRITDEEVRLLSESNTLVTINLHSCNALTNVNPLSSIPTLEVIHLSYCTSLTHLGALGKLPVLKEVNLSSTRITDEEVRLLSESNTLVTINFHSCNALTNVNPLSSIPTLEVVDLTYCAYITHVGALGRLPVLKEVNLSTTRITDEEVRLLSESNTLVTIDLHSCKALTNVNPLSSIATLEVMDLTYCTSLTHLGALGKLRALKEVNLSYTCITDEEVRLLSESNTLVKIALCSCTALTNVNPLSSIATLEVMDLTYCTSLTHLGALGKLPVLKEVYLSYARITDEEVRLLSESNTLVNIALCSCTALTNVNPLSSIATLEVIDLSYCTSLTHLGALGKLPVLRGVYLGETPITDEEVRLLSESNTLVTINLHSCNALTNVNPLSSIATLEVIDLSYCTSLTHLGALGKLPVLKKVYLGETPITDEEVRQLSFLRQQLGLPSIIVFVDVV